MGHVEKILGIGGMGRVVAARHLELDQRVALKFMLPKAATSEQAIDRFLREARAAVRLRNEHVAPGVLARLGITPNVGVVLGLDVPLMLSSGPITTQQGGFGLANITAIAGRAGVDVALAPHYGLRFALNADSVQLTFRPDGAAAMRGVASATDTMLGATAMFVVRD